MSSKRTQRHVPRREGRRSAATGAPSVARGRRRWTWSLGLVLVFGGLMYSGTRFWNQRTRNQSDAGLAATIQSPVGPSSTRPAPKPGSKNQGFNARVNHGTQLLAEGKPAEAVQVLTEALQINPADEDVHYDLGLALARVGRVDEAIQQYQEALRLFPNYVEAHNNLGNLLMRSGHLEEAIQHFEAALKILPDYASAHNNLGTALQRTGHTNEALSHFQSATRINPGYWEAHFNVANSFLQDGRLAEARAELETVVRLQPQFQPARQALAEVQARLAR